MIHECLFQPLLQGCHIDAEFEFELYWQEWKRLALQNKEIVENDPTAMSMPEA